MDLEIYWPGRMWCLLFRLSPKQNHQQVETVTRHIWQKSSSLWSKYRETLLLYCVKLLRGGFWKGALTFAYKWNCVLFSKRNKVAPFLLHSPFVFVSFSIVLDRYQNAMRLPNYPRLDKIPLPLHLQRTKDTGKKVRLQGSTPSSQRETTVIVN